MPVSRSLAVVLKTLPALSQAELAQVQQRLRLLTKQQSTAQDPSQDWLLEGLTLELRRRGLWMRKTPVFRELLPRKYDDTSEQVRAYLLKGMGKQRLQSVELVALGKLAASVLADYLLKLNRPITPKTLLDGLELIPQALEAAFPGYWGSALLAFCLKLRTE